MFITVTFIQLPPQDTSRAAAEILVVVLLVVVGVVVLVVLYTGSNFETNGHNTSAMEGVLTSVSFPSAA